MIQAIQARSCSIGAMVYCWPGALLVLATAAYVFVVRGFGNEWIVFSVTTKRV